MKKLLLILLGAGLFVGALVVGWDFSAANATTIDIDLLWMTIAEVTVWQLVLASFGLGAGLVAVAAGFLGTRGALLRHRYRSTIRKQESELHQLRSLPLSGSREASGDSDELVGEGEATASAVAGRA